MKSLVIRLDDLGRAEAAELEFLEAAAAAGLKFSCGVVPAWLTDAQTKHLKRLARRFPGLVEVHLHGYCHRNYQTNPRMTAYEFGPVRSLEKQCQDLRLGLELLDRAFGKLFVRVFSPPYGEYDDNTLRALQRLGMERITSLRADATASPTVIFPATIDFFHWNPRVEKSGQALATEWEENTAEVQTVVLHPRFMTSASVGEAIRLLTKWSGASEPLHFNQIIPANSGLGTGG